MSSFIIVAFSVDGMPLSEQVLKTRQIAFHVYADMINNRVDIPLKTYMIVIFKITDFVISMIDCHEVIG